MAPRKTSKEKYSNDGAEPSPPPSRRLRRMLRDKHPEPTSTRPTQETTPSTNNELLTAREYLRILEPSTDPHFARAYTNIQSFINDLASAKELFDIKVYNDVKAMLRVH
ncbi:MAG: hypothetical protein Q9192_008167, partial [Flavoplaca navasiana]